jgi:GGDEF-like domain
MWRRSSSIGSGDRDVLVAAKEGLLVVLARAPDRTSPTAAVGNSLGRLMHGELNRLWHGRPWQVAVGRAYPGLYGIAL